MVKYAKLPRTTSIWNKYIQKNEIETLKTIKDIKEALELFETAAIKQGEAISNGNSKIANHNYDKMATVIKFLRTHKSLHELSKFYTHNNISVRLWTAAYLLPVDEKKSLDILKEIVNMKIRGSLDAEMTIQEWKNGNLRNFYTL